MSISKNAVLYITVLVRSCEGVFNILVGGWGQQAFWWRLSDCFSLERGLFCHQSRPRTYSMYFCGFVRMASLIHSLSLSWKGSM